MEAFLVYLALATLLFFIAFGVDLAVGNRSTKFLKDVCLVSDSLSPKVSAIIPARNEEKNIQEALQSVLNQDYPNLEIIALNDRSTDRTGAILAGMAAADARLRLVQVAELPKGWLGKNHALYRGSLEATGELLLFTDADVVMRPSTLSKAVPYLVEQNLHHLTVVPEIRMPGIFLDMFAATFGIFFALYARPWKAKDPKSKRFVGIGAFNLVRSEVYRAAGTHQAIALRPDDDMKLGKLIKSRGYRQELLFGEDMLHVEWYASLGELIHGLMKTGFAGVNYSVVAAVASSAALFAIGFWPWLAIFLTHGATAALNAFTVLLTLAISWDNARFHHLRRWYGIGFPICTILFIYIIWRSMLAAILNHGIDWRGTHYPLAELKANKF
jgi:glycosyltransferase involved in cell wall biosynthesis